ncbi:MAG: protoheme IX farnesyltransferase [Gemmatimonadota bacterium]|nr:MAG: protoheme IX farnesyltransferase [Gemmatimonadota bacterium]
MVGVSVSSRAAADLIELTKPRIILMVMLTVAAGFWMASPSTQHGLLLFHVLLGTVLVAAGTNALNQVAERDLDALMRRTRSRPLPAGRLDVATAAALAWLSGISGVVYLAAWVNSIVATLAAVTLVSYVFGYTPLKRHSSVATLVGAIPGALPIVGGWAAATGGLESQAWALFAILFLWQLPHFLSLGWLYREDYARADVKTLSTNDSDGRRTFRYACLYAAALLPVSLVPTLIGITGGVYFFGAVLLSSAFLYVSSVAARSTTGSNARRLFTCSLVYLPLLLVLMVVNRVA